MLKQKKQSSKQPQQSLKLKPYRTGYNMLAHLKKIPALVSMYDAL